MRKQVVPQTGKQERKIIFWASQQAKRSLPKSDTSNGICSVAVKDGTDEGGQSKVSCRGNAGGNAQDSEGPTVYSALLHWRSGPHRPNMAGPTHVRGNRQNNWLFCLCSSALPLWTLCCIYIQNSNRNCRLMGTIIISSHYFSNLCSEYSYWMFQNLHI